MSLNHLGSHCCGFGPHSGHMWDKPSSAWGWLGCSSWGSLFFIPHHTKSGGILCYTLRTLSVHPSVVHPSVCPSVCLSVSASFPCSNFSTYFLQTLHRHWYWGGVVWDCKWANFILKQQSYGPWCMSKMIVLRFRALTLVPF